MPRHSMHAEARRLSTSMSACPMRVQLGASHDVDAVSIQAADLREASRKAAAARAEGSGEVCVLLDIEVLIASNARSARAALTAGRTPTSLQYVGTPAGLAGLIADIHALRIADGVNLIPLAAPGVVELIDGEVLPTLMGTGLLPSASEAALPRMTEAESVTADDYRATLRRHPAGVAIVTLMSASGPVGFTATSFASLSLDPPLVCFNITHVSSSINAVRNAESLVVHLLGEDQFDVAQRFSRSAAERFADTSLWSTLDTGEPLLHDSPTWLRTAVHQLIPLGDSTLVIGLVTKVRHNDTTALPLLYHDGQYLGSRTLR